MNRWISFVITALLLSSCGHGDQENRYPVKIVFSSPTSRSSNLLLLADFSFGSGDEVGIQQIAVANPCVIHSLNITVKGPDRPLIVSHSVPQADVSALEYHAGTPDNISAPSSALNVSVSSGSEEIMVPGGPGRVFEVHGVIDIDDNVTAPYPCTPHGNPIPGSGSSFLIRGKTGPIDVNGPMNVNINAVLISQAFILDTNTPGFSITDPSHNLKILHFANTAADGAPCAVTKVEARDIDHPYGFHADPPATISLNADMYIGFLMPGHTYDLVVDCSGTVKTRRVAIPYGPAGVIPAPAGPWN